MIKNSNYNNGEAMTKNYLNLEIPVMNGCGILPYLDGFETLEQMGIKLGAVIPKSIGPFSNNPITQAMYGWAKERTGNKNPVMVHTGHVLLNSMALPSHPIESWEDEFENTKLKMPIIASVYGNSPDDYARIIERLNRFDSIKAYEANVSCPNKMPGEKSLMESNKQTEKAEKITKASRDSTDKPLIVKLSPNEDYVLIAEAVKRDVDYITCGNTNGPGLVIDIYSRRPVLAGRTGGMSGPSIMPKNVKMTNDVYNAVKDSGVKIIGSGGIEKWQDIIQYAIAGASLYQLGTCFLKQTNDGRVLGMTNEEIVKKTKEIWKGVEKHCRERKVPLERLVGSLIG
jgi:dihydroorotate dehydrogenase (NAD+) catalytic subunit